MFTSSLVQGLWLFTFAGCLLSFLKGGAPERLGALIVLGNLAVSWLIDTFAPETALPLLRMASDILTALALLAVTLRYGSLWLGAAMLLYAVQFGLHSFYFVTERPNDLLHAVVNNVVFFGVSVCVASGAALAWIARRRQPA